MNQVTKIDKILKNIEYTDDLQKSDDKKESDIFENMRSFVINPRNGVLLVPHLSERVDFSTSSDKLEEVIDIICEKVFNPPTERSAYIAPYAAFCKGFADLKVTKEEKGFKRTVTFEQILVDKMLNKLEEKFTYKYRLSEQKNIRAGTEDTKQRWLENQTEKQQRNLKSMTRSSITFVKEIHTPNSETIYKIMDFLLENVEEEYLEYLCHLLKAMGRGLDVEIARRYRVKSAITKHLLSDESIKLNDVFRRISMLATGNPSISTRIRTMMQDLIKLRQTGWKLPTPSEDKISLQSDAVSTNKSLKSLK